MDLPSGSEVLACVSWESKSGAGTALYCPAFSLAAVQWPQALLDGLSRRPTHPATRKWFRQDLLLLGLW